VPYDAPSTLYYVCELHGSMGGTINVVNANEDLFLRSFFTPTAPTSVTATATNAQAEVSWTAPAIVVPPLTDYSVQFSTDSGSTWTTFVETTVAITTQPSNQTAASGAATFSVTATVSPSGTLTYQWEKSDDAGTTFTAVSGATSATLSLTSLTNASDNNDQYRVVVSAVGASPVTSSAATLTVTQVPNAPTSLAATAGNAQLALTWTAPSAPGSSAITGYTVEYTPSGGSAQTVSTGGTGTSYTLTGLTNGTAYTVRVAAVSAAGTGSYSTSASGTPLAISFVAIPEMTSNTSPSGTVLTFGTIRNGFLTDGTSAAWFWFSRKDSGGSSLSSENIQPVLPANASIGYQFASGQSLISGFEIAQSRRVSNHYAAAFVFAGSNDGSNWTTISTHSGFNGWDDEYQIGFWQPAVVKIFNVSPSAAYSMYRWTITSAPGGFVEWSKVQLRQ
jgi:cellulose 1,4-beta-cellobiosidase